MPAVARPAQAQLVFQDVAQPDALIASFASTHRVKGIIHLLDDMKSIQDVQGIAAGRLAAPAAMQARFKVSIYARQ